MSSLTVPTNIKFDAAIDLTQVFLTQLAKNELTSSQILDFVSALIQTSNGARGFFVTYLTIQDPICDEPQPEIIAAIAAHPSIAANMQSIKTNKTGKEGFITKYAPEFKFGLRPNHTPRLSQTQLFYYYA